MDLFGIRCTTKTTMKKSMNTMLLAPFICWILGTFSCSVQYLKAQYCMFDTCGRLKEYRTVIFKTIFLYIPYTLCYF